MKNTYFAIYEQGAICWEACEYLAEAQDFLTKGAEIEALYPIAIYNVETKQLVWQNPDLSEETITEELHKLRFH
jgi:hypothetical protein